MAIYFDNSKVAVTAIPEKYADTSDSIQHADIPTYVKAEALAVPHDRQP